jgi:carboxymethylenebutenolidase
MSRALLLLHAWWGLNKDVLARAEQLRGDGYVVSAPDLFGGRIATTIDEAKALTKGESGNEATITALVDEALVMLARHNDRLAVVSWSFGNWYAWKTALAHPEHVRAFVSFYGLAVGDTARKLPPTLSHYAEHDEFEDLDATRKAADELRSAGTDIRLELYPGTKHWFDERSRPEYDKAASELAWERTRAFLAKQLLR